MHLFPVIIPRHPALKASSVEEADGRLICLMLRGMWVAKTFCIGCFGRLKMEFGIFQIALLCSGCRNGIWPKGLLVQNDS